MSARRGTAVAAAIVVVAAGAAALIAGPLAGSGHAAAGGFDNGDSVALARVSEGPLRSQIDQSGTLGFAAGADGSPYTVVGESAGTLTSLPVPGQVTACGGVIYRVANEPVLLLCGRTPAYRTLSEGDSGPDVRELNRELVRLGDATRGALDPSPDYFGAATAVALDDLQRAHGLTETGSLPLGQAVFLPRAIRVEQVMGTLGTAAAPGAPVMTATSTVPQVTVQLDAAQQASIRLGDAALITLPDNAVVDGRVSAIGRVASGGQNGATIPVSITLRHRRGVGDLDQAPVQVQITVGGLAHALIAPVDGLLALAGGGYALESVTGRGVHRLVPVSTGLFDDADGLVSVRGAGLTDGMQIVVPAT